MTKLQVFSTASLLLISNLCSASSTSIFNYDADGAESRGGLRGQGQYGQTQDVANLEGSGALIREVPEQDEPRQGSAMDGWSEGNDESQVEENSKEGNPTEAHQAGPLRKRRQGNSRIIGGYEATPNLHSYAASLHDRLGHFCGGSLITRNAILTAAHCQGGSYSVALGRHDLTTREGQAIRMKRELPHPDYDDMTTDFDFMLVFLRSPATLNTDVTLVKLNDDPDVPRVGQSCTPMGWGDTDAREAVSKLSDVLMKTEVRVISQEECNDSRGRIGGYEDSYDGLITRNMLCAEAPRRDSCQGDSGGPLVTTYGEKQVGVVSWGIGCASDHFPGVYARVSRVYPWIEREVCRENRQYATEAGFQC